MPAPRQSTELLVAGSDVNRIRWDDERGLAGWPHTQRRDDAAGAQPLELGLGCVIFGRATAHDSKYDMTRNILGRAVSRISARRAVWYDLHFGLCLSRHSTKITHRPVHSPLFYYNK